MATTLYLKIEDEKFVNLNLCLFKALESGLLESGDWFEYGGIVYVINRVTGVFAFSPNGDNYMSEKAAKDIALHEIRVFSEVNVTAA